MIPPRLFPRRVAADVVARVRSDAADVPCNDGGGQRASPTADHNEGERETGEGSGERIEDG